MTRAYSSAAAAAVLLSGCQPIAQGEQSPVVPGQPQSVPWAGISTAETIRFTGTEPFWGGEVTGGMLLWRTPEDQSGTRFAVERFAGRNGLGFSGRLQGAAFQMAVSEAACSDGMSDRTYPFTVTVQYREQTLSGCGWTEVRSFSGPATP